MIEFSNFQPPPGGFFFEVHMAEIKVKLTFGPQPNGPATTGR